MATFAEILKLDSKSRVSGRKIPKPWHTEFRARYDIRGVIFLPNVNLANSTIQNDALVEPSSR